MLDSSQRVWCGQELIDTILVEDTPLTGVLGCKQSPGIIVSIRDCEGIGGGVEDWR